MCIRDRCGEHELDITIENQPVKGGPFVLHVHQQRNYASLYCQISFGTSSYPYDVIVDDNGNVYVASYNYHCIDVFDQQGTMIRKIGTPGSYGQGDGQFYNPSGIAIRGEVLYITDESNHRVQKITTSGKFISKFGSYGSGNEQFNTPRGICLDCDGRIFVSEYGANRVSVFEPDGAFVYHITTGNLSEPWGLAFDPSGSLHVSNYGSSLVSIFSPNGVYITNYDSQVSNPAGITIDEEGNSFIAEHYNHPSSYNRYNRNSSYNYSRFSVLNPNHQLIRHNVLQNFPYASGITIDKEGFIYVCSANTNQVYKY